MGAIATDSREQFAFEFTDIFAGPERLPVNVRTHVVGLKSGDYSLIVLEDRIAVERKSLNDLFGTLTRGRDRFERELERLAEFDFSAVVVEGTWFDIGERPPFASRVNPACILALQQRFKTTHWLTCGGRRTGQWLTYGILRRFWIDQVETPAKDEHKRLKVATKEQVPCER